MADWHYQNSVTGDTLEVPPPDKFGNSCIRVNGKEVVQCHYCDDDMSVTIGDGTRFTVYEWQQYLIGLIDHTRKDIHA